VNEVLHSERNQKNNITTAHPSLPLRTFNVLAAGEYLIDEMSIGKKENENQGSVAYYDRMQFAFTSASLY
jgi:hypothetical protein